MNCGFTAEKRFSMYICIDIIAVLFNAHPWGRTIPNYAPGLVAL
jgi:hypothetical protein